MKNILLFMTVPVAWLLTLIATVCVAIADFLMAGRVKFSLDVSIETPENNGDVNESRSERPINFERD